MPTRETKQLTRQDGFVPSTESAGRGSPNDAQGAPPALGLSVDQCRGGVQTPARAAYSMLVPVIDSARHPLMPTTASRARRWIKSGEATPFFKRGIFCVRLNREPLSRGKQEIAVGIDPGSKKEGYTVKSEAHTYLNINADAVTWVKDAVETRRNMRRVRRYRKTPCRADRKTEHMDAYRQARRRVGSGSCASWRS
jgi:hypothetical protein